MSNFQSACSSSLESEPTKHPTFRKTDSSRLIPSGKISYKISLLKEEKEHKSNQVVEQTSTVPYRDLVGIFQPKPCNSIVNIHDADSVGGASAITGTSDPQRSAARARPGASKITQNHFRNQHHQTYDLPPKAMSLLGPVRLFIASLGNPPPYQNTRHSAGHILLKSLQSHLRLPPLSKSKSFAGGHISHGSEVGLPQYTLWQSPSLMNVSGLNLLKAYKTFLSTLSSDETDALLILHDEMETAPAQIKLRRGPTSPKGHNGIKSVQQSFLGAGLMDRLAKDNGGRFLKVGVGIGRPEGGTRDKDDVSNYVLGQLKREERDGIEGCAGRLVELLDAEIARIGAA